MRYLWRHQENSTTISARTLLLQHGYTHSEINNMIQEFPPLEQLNVPHSLHPKLLFLQHSILNQSDDDVIPQPIRARVPPQYYGMRLERILAPRHAFLVHHNLPHGLQLFEREGLFAQFLQNTNIKHFTAMCNAWQPQTRFTSEQIQDFDASFAKGLLACARNEISEDSITVSQLIHLLVRHGANALERDTRGSTLLHWAAGTGNLDGLMALQQHCNLLSVKTHRDGATLLHWAAAGVNAHEFGTGGHAHVCQYLLEQHQFDKDYINALTFDGNSALMWAAWSGSLNTVKLLIQHGANTTVVNENGCTLAHWATSGGSLEVCQYLASIEVDFSVPNHGGNTPLTHAVAFGRANVVEWLRQHQDDSDDDAQRLAQDFVDWGWNR